MSSHDGSGALLGRLWTSPTASSSLCKSSKEGENCANVVWQDCLHCLHGHSLAAQRLNTVALDLTSCEAVFPATFRGRFADLGDGLEISSPGFSVLGKDGQVYHFGCSTGREQRNWIQNIHSVIGRGRDFPQYDNVLLLLYEDERKKNLELSMKVSELSMLLGEASEDRDSIRMALYACMDRLAASSNSDSSEPSGSPERAGGEIWEKKQTKVESGAPPLSNPASGITSIQSNRMEKKQKVIEELRAEVETLKMSQRAESQKLTERLTNKLQAAHEAELQALIEKNRKLEQTLQKTQVTREALRDNLKKSQETMKALTQEILDLKAQVSALKASETRSSKNIDPPSTQSWMGSTQDARNDAPGSGGARVRRVSQSPSLNHKNALSKVPRQSPQGHRFQAVKTFWIDDEEEGEGVGTVPSIGRRTEPHEAVASPGSITDSGSLNMMEKRQVTLAEPTDVAPESVIGVCGGERGGFSGGPTAGGCHSGFLVAAEKAQSAPRMSADLVSATQAAGSPSSSAGRDIGGTNSTIRTQAWGTGRSPRWPRAGESARRLLHAMDTDDSD